MKHILFVAMLLIPTIARAQEAVTEPEAVSEAPQLRMPTFQPLRRGQAAPSDGVLVQIEEMAQIRLDYDALTYRLTRDAERADGRCRVQLDIEHAHTRAAEERLALHVGLWEGRQGELVAAVAQARAEAVRQWYESEGLWAGIGALVASLVAILVAQL